MIVVGVTGGLASGKSEVTRLFKKMGARVFSADLAAKKAVQKGQPAYKAIIKLFGREFLKKNGDLQRKKFAQHIFSHPRDLKKVNILIHPGVIFDCINVMHKMRNKKGILVLDVPLLFESKMETLADIIVVVTANQTRLLRRAQKKGMPLDLAKKILSSQWKPERKIKLADFVIKNESSLSSLETQVKRILKKIREEK